MCKIYIVIFTTICVAGSEPCANVTNKNVERVIDLKSQLVKITSTITVRNDGLDTLEHFSLYLEAKNHCCLSYMSVTDSEGDELEMTCFNEQCIIKMNKPLNPKQNKTFVSATVYTGTLQAYPKAIRQSDQQLMLYFGNIYFYSPYHTERQTTKVVLNSRNIENYTSHVPHVVAGDVIKYGPLNNIAPSKYDQMVIHYESNAAFLSITRLRRWITVSYWGKFSVHEDIHLEHTGATLTAQFSRFDYDRNQVNPHHYVKSYVTVLPASAHDIYYGDVNGNIFTYTVRDRNDYTEVELQPRFPLFGGWKSSYVFGYYLLSDVYLFKAAANQHVVRVPLLDHVFDDMHVGELQTSIILPFGAQNVKVELPFEAEHSANVTVHKYLDVWGHTVVNIWKMNLVEAHIQNVEVVYEWRPYFLVYEPILLVVSLFVLFLVVIVCIRIDFFIDTGHHLKRR